MAILVVLLLMILAHIVDDFYLQPMSGLNKLKQRAYWENHISGSLRDSIYKHDYIVGLIIHSISWSIAILLPIFIYYKWHPHWFVYIAFGVNAIVHAIVDDLKANRGKLNLIADQLIHLIQIGLTFMTFVLIIY